MPRIALFFGLIVFIAFPSFAQKVALVMSGGGAKGIAHAGVIKVLEENDIPIDYVVGTSMGSIVGAFYAAGYTPDEIVMLATSQDMKDWVNGVVEEKYRSSFFEKNPNPSWVTFKLNLDSGFHASFDITLDRDHVLNINLAERLAEASYISAGDFNKLIVPYRSTASEIFTEQQILLDSGVLYEATRSSMAVPIFYRAVRVNGKLLFDGGVYDNFPVTEARQEFKPDIIIGANVGAKQLKEYPYENDEALIAESVLMFMLNKSNLDDLDSTDVLIDIPVQSFSPLDFESASEIYAAGEKAALEKIPEIKEKISSRQSSEQIREKRKEFLDKKTELLFDSVAIEGYAPMQSEFVHKMFPKNRPLSMEEIKRGYFRLISDDYFLNVFPTYSFKNENKFILRGNPNPRLKAKVGGSLTSRSVSYIFLGFDFKKLNRTLDHYSANVFAGQFYRSFLFRSEYKLPGKKQFAIQPSYTYNNWDYINSEDLVFGDDRLNVLERFDHKVDLKFKFALSRKFGFNWTNSYYVQYDDFGNSDSYNTADQLDNLRLKGYQSQLALAHNSLNYPQYANEGSHFGLEINYFFTKEKYEPGSTSAIPFGHHKNHHWVRAKLLYERYNKIGSKYRLGYLVEGVISNQPVFGTTSGTINTQPGFFPLQDSKTMILKEFRSRNYAAIGLKNIFIPKKDFEIRLEGYAFNSFENVVGVSNQIPTIDKTDFDPKLSGTFGLVYHSIIGPVSVSVNYYDDSRMRWGGFLHLGYLLFNKQALE